MYCTVQYCTALYCTVMYCTVLYLCCTVLYCRCGEASRMMGPPNPSPPEEQCEKREEEY